MEHNNSTVIHGEGCEKPIIKEEYTYMDEITELQTSYIQQCDKQFVRCVQSSNVDNEIEMLQETWDLNLSSSDVKSYFKQPFTWLGTGTVKVEDELDITEHGIQDEMLPESQRQHLQESDTRFMEYNMSNVVDNEVVIKQEDWDPNGVSSTLDPVPFICTKTIKGDDGIDIKQELCCYEEKFGDTLNEREGSDSKKNDAAEDVPLLLSSRSYNDVVYSSSATQLQESKNIGCLPANTNVSAEECEAEHRCKTCGKEFKLWSHLLKHTLVPKECKWINCDKNCTYSCVLKDCVIHNNTRKYLCDICGQIFSSLGNFKTHLTVHTVQCPICQRSLKNLPNLKRHLLIHDGKRQHKCNICEKAFKHPRNLRAHLLVHDDNRHYKCETCGQCVKRLNDLKSHLLIHEDKRQYLCQICAKSFRYSRNLKAHLLTHDDRRRYKCQICEKSFKYLGTLKTHVLIHNDNRPHKCQLCEKSFKMLGNLKTHVLTHNSRPVGNGRQVVCDICDKIFEQIAAFKSHLSVHVDKRQYKCQICEKSFKQLCYLKRHHKIHGKKS